mmetsp:Transcript_46898/g.101890  ORF Transcript_46898/g.101890 Transcript_46898/m.101890 type:complete len:237 (+) Transcript_46898:75-785(+)
MGLGLETLCKMGRVQGYRPILPYFRRTQEAHKKMRYRQLPFLAVSKEPSIPPAPPDPRAKKLTKVDLARLMNIEVGDRVQILYGREKGTLGIVGRIIRERNQVIVTGAYMVRSFWHPEPGPGRPSIISAESPIHITNVVPIDPVTKQPTRIKRRYDMNGECVRVSKISGSAMPAPVPVGPNEREELWKLHKMKTMVEDKERRGPMKEDVFGNKDHFKMLTRIMRARRESEERAAGR